jgi:hypothetical protein
VKKSDEVGTVRSEVDTRGEERIQLLIKIADLFWLLLSKIIAKVRVTMKKLNSGEALLNYYN